jgi:hypothetical protein
MEAFPNHFVHRTQEEARTDNEMEVFKKYSSFVMHLLGQKSGRMYEHAPDMAIDPNFLRRPRNKTLNDLRGAITGAAVISVRQTAMTSHYRGATEVRPDRLGVQQIRLYWLLTELAADC